MFTTGIMAVVRNRHIGNHCDRCGTNNCAKWLMHNKYLCLLGLVCMFIPKVLITASVAWVEPS